MLIAVRATHANLGLDGLERITRGSEGLDEALEVLNEEHPEQPLTGWVAMATCNRLEIYLDADRFHDAVGLVTEAIARTSGLMRETVAASLMVDAGKSSTRHIYEVAAGLDSQVMGEAEITGQVRTSFSEALAAGRTTTLLNDLFQGSLRTAKSVTTTTKVGAAGRSSVAVALDAAAPYTGELEEKSALIIGTGAMARVASAELHRRGVGNLSVHSPSGRAEAFAATHAATPVTAEELPTALADAAIVVAASGGGHKVITRHNVEPAMRNRAATAGELVILDLSLHSDVEAEVKSIDGVHLISLASLSAGESEQSEIERAHALVTAGVTRFEERQRIRSVDPAVSALRRGVKDAIALEVNDIRRTQGEDAANLVEKSLRKVYKKLLHSPMVRAQELAKSGQADQFLEAVHTIFGVNVAGSMSVDAAQQASENNPLEFINPASEPELNVVAPPMTVAHMEQLMREHAETVMNSEQSNV